MKWTTNNLEFRTVLGLLLLAPVLRGQPGEERIDRGRTTRAGARINAAAVVQGLRDLKPNPLAAALLPGPSPDIGK